MGQESMAPAVAAMTGLEVRHVRTRYCSKGPEKGNMYSTQPLRKRTRYCSKGPELHDSQPVQAQISSNTADCGDASPDMPSAVAPTQNEAHYASIASSRRPAAKKPAKLSRQKASGMVQPSIASVR